MSSGGKQIRAQRALDDVDTMPGELRACVHEFGYAIVKKMRDHGVSKPAAIREIVRECWSGPRAPMQASRVPRGLEKLDWFLSQRGLDISAKTLWRMLADEMLFIVPMGPSRAMLEASMNEVVPSGPRMTKEEKHRRRYMAAIRAHYEAINREIEASA
jgi:hypothetical protein